MVNKMSEIIKGVLREELLNSLEMEKLYEEKLAQLPKGNLVKKKINGHYYYYLQYRKGKKIKCLYKGKNLRSTTIEKYENAKLLRKKYRNCLSEVKQQIKYLKGILREPRTV